MSTRVKQSTLNLAGWEVRLTAGDDARKTLTCAIDDIANGSVVMPFLHVYWVLEAMKQVIVKCPNTDTIVIERLEVVFLLAQHYNFCLMNQVNKVLATHFPGLLQFQLPEKLDEDKLRADAARLGIDPSKYFEVSDDDIAQCSPSHDPKNSFNRDQLAVPGKAGDSVEIITDFDGRHHLVGIIRANGPGRDRFALAGGFLEEGETFSEAALRERDEETGVSVLRGGSTVQLTFDITTTKFPEVEMSLWDPRARFPHGMIVGATLTHKVAQRVF